MNSPGRLTSHEALTAVGTSVPRRKYGHMVKAIPPVAEDKCRYCRLGIPCPVHKKKV